MLWCSNNASRRLCWVLWCSNNASRRLRWVLWCSVTWRLRRGRAGLCGVWPRGSVMEGLRGCCCSMLGAIACALRCCSMLGGVIMCALRC